MVVGDISFEDTKGIMTDGLASNAMMLARYAILDGYEPDKFTPEHELYLVHEFFDSVYLEPYYLRKLHCEFPLLVGMNGDEIRNVRCSMIKVDRRRKGGKELYSRLVETKSQAIRMIEQVYGGKYDLCFMSDPRPKDLFVNNGTKLLKEEKSVMDAYDAVNVGKEENLPALLLRAVVREETLRLYRNEVASTA